MTMSIDNKQNASILPEPGLFVCDLSGSNQVWSWLLQSACFDDAYASYWTLLSPKEKKRAEAVPQKDTKLQFVVSRGFLRETVGNYLGVHPEDLIFSYELSGKPRLQYPQSSMGFNVSHTSGAVLVGICARGNIGVDVERGRIIDGCLQITENYFSSCEYR